MVANIIPELLPKRQFGDRKTPHDRAACRNGGLLDEIGIFRKIIQCSAIKIRRLFIDGSLCELASVNGVVRAVHVMNRKINC